MTEREWRITHQTVREDAQGVFISADELPDAAVGDTVVVEGGPAPDRTGVVRAVVDDEDGRYVIVDFADAT